MFTLTKPSKIFIPDARETSDNTDSLQINHPQHLALLHAAKSKAAVKTIPLQQRIKAARYLIEAIFYFTDTHAKQGTELYIQKGSGNDYSHYPIDEQNFTDEINALTNIFLSINYSPKLVNGFLGSFAPIADELQANSNWRALQNNWRVTNKSDVETACALFYDVFCRYFSFADKILTPPILTQNENAPPDNAATLRIIKTPIHEQLKTELYLTQDKRVESFHDFANTLFHEGVHLVMAHLNHFAMAEAPPEDHHIHEDLALNVKLFSNKVRPASFIPSTCTTHPEERLAYKIGDKFGNHIKCRIS